MQGLEEQLSLTLSLLTEVGVQSSLNLFWLRLDYLLFLPSRAGCYLWGVVGELSLICRVGEL